MHWDEWHMGGSMGIWWILIVAAIVAVIWFAVGASRRGGDRRESPERALKRRFGNGEIDREAYERTLEELRK